MTGGNTPAVHGGKDVPVSMVWEEVDLRPSAGRNEVVALFGLKNVGDEPAEFEVGFPSFFKMPMKDFVIEIDGEKAEAVLKKDQTQGPKRIFIYWMCWPMKFAAGQEHKVKVSYWVEPESARYVSRTATVKGRPTTINEPAISGEGLESPLREQVGAKSSGYILRTGAAWRDTIGKATIRLHYGEQFKKDLVTNLAPAKGWTFDESANTSTLILDHIKPTSADDIAYQWRLADPETEKAKLMEALRDGKLSTAARMQLAEVMGYNMHAVKRHPPPPSNSRSSSTASPPPARNSATSKSPTTPPRSTTAWPTANPSPTTAMPTIKKKPSPPATNTPSLWIT